MDLLSPLLPLILGLPWTAWLLWIASVGPGLLVALVFFFKHRRGAARRLPPPDKEA